jgi:tetratricopeptide (TPR) repeat protein
MRLLAALVVSLGTGECAWPQNLPKQVHGELNVQAGASAEGYTVTVYDAGSRLEVDHADVDAEGSFTLELPATGDYALRVRDENGHLVREEYVNAGARNAPINIAVAGHIRTQPAGGTISIKELMHPPSKKAVQAFASARQFADSAQYARAAEELEKAVRISPDFAQAHTNLGVQYFRLHRYEEAVAESRRAIELSSPTPRDQVNLAVALWALNRRDEALDAVRTALALDSGFVQAHFVLGSLEVGDPATLADGLRHLERAAGEIPAAAASLARIHTAMMASAH